MNDITNAPMKSTTIVKPAPAGPLPSGDAAPPASKQAKEAVDEETLKMLNGGSLPGAGPGGGGETMQQRFARFKRERQRERKLQQFMLRSQAVERSPAFRDALRCAAAAQGTGFSHSQLILRAALGSNEKALSKLCLGGLQGGRISLNRRRCRQGRLSRGLPQVPRRALPPQVPPGPRLAALRRPALPRLLRAGTDAAGVRS